MKRSAKRASKPVARKSTAKRAKRVSKDVDLSEIRQKVRNLVASRAVSITTAVVEEIVKKAQVPQMRGLFEMIGLFGADAAPDAPPEDDQALAKVLLDRFNLPDLPITEEDERAPLVVTAAVTEDSVK